MGSCASSKRSSCATADGYCYDVQSHDEKNSSIEEDTDTSCKESFNKLYKLGRTLGSDTSSIVKNGHHRKSGETYAVKVIDKDGLSIEDEESLKLEINLLNELKEHPSIIYLHDVFDEQSFYYLITEKMVGGVGRELFEHIGEKSNYTENDAKDITIILLQAIQHCHNHHIVHRDLKPENILLSSKRDDWDIKIVDFGYAKKCNNDESLLQTLCGTPGYMAPEILKGDTYGTQVDMWSLGVIIYILLGGYRPFAEKTQQALFRKIKKGDYDYHDKYWNHISEQAKDFISSLLTVNPDKRSTASIALKESEWIIKQCDDDDDELSSHDLSINLRKLRAFNARRKIKADGFAILGAILFSLDTLDDVEAEWTSNSKLPSYVSFYPEQ